MGTRSLTIVMGQESEVLCMYRQMDGYPTGHGKELKQAFQGFVIVNGLGDNNPKVANGMGCLAAQIVARFKTQPGKFYLYPTGSHDVGEEYVYTVSNQDGKIWLDITEGRITAFGMPSSRPKDKNRLYSGPLDDMNPEQVEKQNEFHGG